MIRLLIISYEVIVEIAVWCLFAVSAWFGYRAAGMWGLAAGLAGSFAITVFLVAPAMVLNDVRKTLARMEKSGLKPRDDATTAKAPPRKEPSFKRPSQNF